MTKGQERKLEVAEMRMLRFPMGLKRADRVRNEEVRTCMRVEEFRGKLSEVRLRWYGHVLRKEKDYVEKRPHKAGDWE